MGRSIHPIGRCRCTLGGGAPCGRAPGLIVWMSLRPANPRQVGLHQSPPLLHRPASLFHPPTVRSTDSGRLARDPITGRLLRITCFARRPLALSSQGVSARRPMARAPLFMHRGQAEAFSRPSPLLRSRLTARTRHSASPCSGLRRAAAEDSGRGMHAEAGPISPQVYGHESDEESAPLGKTALEEDSVEAGSSRTRRYCLARRLDPACSIR